MTILARAMPLLILVLATTLPALAQDLPPDRKLIEYGWDVPTPDFIAQHIAGMEQRPFDGLIFRLNGGSNVLEPTAWEEAKFAQDYQLLPTIPWSRFTDNFVIMHAATEMDWFNDDHWRAIENNTRLVARAAKLAKCVGICFDPEPYGTNPWHYSELKKRADKPFTDYNRVVRQRGAQFIKAIESELPNPKILTFYLLNLFDRFAVPLSPEDRSQRLSEHDYALYPAFIEGMLEGSGPNTELIDGNESAYYYSSPDPYFEAYLNGLNICRRIIDPALWPAYRAKGRMGQALYVDQYHAMRTMELPSTHMTPEERTRWFEHNVYWALYTTDQYVWCYSERMNWWTNENVPPGAEEAIRSARNKINTAQGLGFEVQDLVEEAAKRK